jgi:hypothetical protein
VRILLAAAVGARLELAVVRVGLGLLVASVS